jgi:hypothetical protein
MATPFMTANSRVLPALACVALLAISGTSRAGQDAAKRYFQNGVELITAAEPNYQDAYYQFQLAYGESSKSWKVLGNLGLCALKLERDQEAVSYYDLYLEKGGAEINQDERNAIEQDLLLLRGNLASVRITSKIPDLKLIDRRAGSQAPAQSYALSGGVINLELRAGNHTITATSAGKQLSWEVVLEPKTSSSHDFDFEARLEPTAAIATPAAPSSQQRDSGSSAGSSGLRVPGYVALVTGAAVAAAGGYFMWQVSDYDAQAEDAFACDASVARCSAAQQEQVRQLENDAAAARTRALFAFGVGGAALMTGAVLLLMPDAPEQQTPRKASLTPWVGFGSAGISGSF